MRRSGEDGLEASLWPQTGLALYVYWVELSTGGRDNSAFYGVTVLGRALGVFETFFTKIYCYFLKNIGKIFKNIYFFNMEICSLINTSD